jgi:NAD(P)-dependent dehydrogenase (short-subunit alcohol dehydrogenase family)
MNHAERTFIISGAGTGIGRAIAIALAAAGNRVILLGRTEATLEDTRVTLTDPDRHRIIVADVRDAHALRQQLDRLAPTLTGIVANAGICSSNAYGDDDCWDQLLDVNLKGTYVFVQEAMRFIAPPSAGYRHVLVVSSLTSRIGLRNYSAYTASKTAQLGLVRCWAMQYAHEKILVNALVPGFVKGEMAERGFADLAASDGIDYETMLRKQLNHIPLRKICEPEEIGAYAEFLLPGKQISITGQAIDINNGVAMT